MTPVWREAEISSWGNGSSDGRTARTNAVIAPTIPDSITEPIAVENPAMAPSVMEPVD